MTEGDIDAPDPRAVTGTGGGPERVTLPEWLRNPAAPRMTLGRRWSLWVTSRPRLQAARESWWAWRDRPRWSDRFPRTMPVISFVLVAVAAAGLVFGALYLFVAILARLDTAR